MNKLFVILVIVSAVACWPASYTLGEERKLNVGLTSTEGAITATPVEVQTATIIGKIAGISFSSSGDEKFWVLKIDGSIKERDKSEEKNVMTYVIWDSEKVEQRQKDNPSSTERPTIGIGSMVTIKANKLDKPRYVGVDVDWVASELLVHGSEK